MHFSFSSIIELFIECAKWARIVYIVVNIVVDKTGVIVTSTIWLISPNAASMRGMRQIGLVAGSPVLSTTGGKVEKAKWEGVQINRWMRVDS